MNEYFNFFSRIYLNNENNYNNNMNFLIISTFPHYIVLLVGPTKLYNSVVFCSSTLSVLWHYSNTPVSSYLGILDHIFAFIWLATDYYYFKDTQYLQRMIIINALTFFANIYVSYLDKHNVVPYHIGHSVWHLLSAAKSIYLAHSLNSKLITA